MQTKKYGWFRDFRGRPRVDFRLHVYLLAVLHLPPREYLALARPLLLLWLLIKVRAYTMVSVPRLFNVYRLAWRAENRGEPGSFVECGAWRGGCAGIMAMVAQRAGNGRKTWLFDSWQGLPEPTILDGDRARKWAQDRITGKLDPIGENVASQEEAEHLLFRVLGLERRNVCLVKGWFQDTLLMSKGKVGPIAVLRLDGDWYESTKFCLDSLYDQVIVGGHVIIDDYDYWAGCKKAVDEFLDSRHLDIKLYRADGQNARYFVKPKVHGRPT